MNVIQLIDEVKEKFNNFHASFVVQHSVFDHYVVSRSGLFLIAQANIPITGILVFMQNRLHALDLPADNLDAYQAGEDFEEGRTYWSILDDNGHILEGLLFKKSATEARKWLED